MQPLGRHAGRMVPLDRADVDTDQIVPKQFCKRVERTGYGPCLFFNWRQEEADFVLDRPQYLGASILVAGANFGCGSSREHAVWALEDAGYRVIVAPSFGDIFRNNCHKVGLLPVQLAPEDVRSLMRIATSAPDTTATVDLERQSFETAGLSSSFPIDPFVKECLGNGWDDIDLTLRWELAIADHEARLPEWITSDTLAAAPRQ